MRELCLDGIFPPLTTPFDDRGEVDFKGLTQNITRYNETGLSGYVAFGSNGEAVHLTADERIQILETIRRAAAPGMKLIAGVNELSARAAIESARRAVAAGADVVLVVTPYFYKTAMTQEVLANYFREVADASPRPVLIYNVPQNTGVVIESATIARLAAHPNIIGVKDSAGNMGAISETIRLTPEDFNVLVGNGSILFPALMMGAKGAVLAVACAAPHACVELHRAVKAGDMDRARDLQKRIGPLSHTVTAGFGVAGLKAALEMAGFIGGAPRSPLAPVSPANREKIKEVMQTTGLFPGIE